MLHVHVLHTVLYIHVHVLNAVCGVDVGSVCVCEGVVWVTSCCPRSYVQRTAWSTAPVFLFSLSTTGGKTPYTGGQKERNGSCWKTRVQVPCPFETETTPWRL